MSTVDAKSNAALGFLTVVDHPQLGLFGGYLILNKCGRPLEFHCTAPIKPNRAQQILYGPTLEPFLYGEQIGQTLVAKAKIEPVVVCTDQEPALAVRECVSVPVVLVIPDSRVEMDHQLAVSESPSADSAEASLRLDQSHGRRCPLVHFRLGRNHLALPEGTDEDRRLIAERMAGLAESFDLAEPFARIREAIEEAQRAVR